MSLAHIIFHLVDHYKKDIIIYFGTRGFPARYLNITTFFVVSNIVFVIMSVDGFVLNATFMLCFFLACYVASAILGVLGYLNKEDRSLSGFIDAMVKEALQIVAIAFTLYCFFDFYSCSALLVVLKISSVLFSCQAVMRAVKPGISWRDGIINLLSVLILAMSLVVMFNVYGVVDFIGFPVVESFGFFSFFSFFMFFGYYDVKDNKIAWGTFDLDACPKYLLGFLIQFVFICVVVLGPVAISFIMPIPIAQYLTYMIFMIPMVFNQTFALEFMCRSSILYLKEQLGDRDPYHIVYGVFFIAGSLLFALGYFTFFQISFMGLMFYLAYFLPTAVAWMVLTAYSDGIEYSAGAHFANNMVLVLLLPIGVINGAHAVTMTWPLVLIALLYTSVYVSVSSVPLMLCEKYFTEELAIDEIPVIAVGRLENELEIRQRVPDGQEARVHANA